MLHDFNGENVMAELQEFIIENYDKNQKIIIYGAGVYGELCLRALQVYGIEVYAFADRRTDLLEYLGVKVIRPRDIKNISNAIVLITSINYIKQIVLYLKEEEIENYYKISKLLRTEIDKEDLSDYAKRTREDPLEYARKIDDYEKEELTINNIDLVITQFCNLKCKDCGSLIPYYQKPCHFEYEKIVLYFDRFLQSVEYIKELRLLGGETFLYPDLVRLVDYYCNNSKIGKVVIYSNGVMKPADSIIEKLFNEKVLIRISNYGKLSKSITEIVDVCKSLNIKYEILDSMIWRDMGGVERRDYSKEQCINVYEKCENAKCPSFCKGKLYICPRAAHGEVLGFYENGIDEYIDFTVDGVNYNDYKWKIEELLFGRNLFGACFYCNGNNKWENAIPAAIQIDREKEK